MDGKFFPRLRPRELCEAALGKALPQKNAEEKGPKRKASVLLSCWDARGCSQEGEPVDQIEAAAASTPAQRAKGIWVRTWSRGRMLVAWPMRMELSE